MSPAILEAYLPVLLNARHSTYACLVIREMVLIVSPKRVEDHACTEDHSCTSCLVHMCLWTLLLLPQGGGLILLPLNQTL